MNLKKTGLVLGPLFFISLILLSDNLGGLSNEGWKVLSVAGWMVIWWVTEAVSISVTALLPIVLFPAVGVFSISEATAPYASRIIFLFMGGFIIALGLEKHNLHTRIALNLIKITGTSGNGVILGFMLATALLSMWISNTATAVMMLPIALSVVNLLNRNKTMGQSHKTFAMALMLIIAYSANIGGMMTLIGTPPNVVFAGYVQDLQNKTLDFSSWLLVGLPSGILLLTLTYFMITKLLFKSNLKKIDGAKELIGEQLNTLGKMKTSEIAVLVIFGLTAMGWVFKNEINSLFNSNYLSDPLTAMIGGILMFTVPYNWKKNTKVLLWSDTQKLPWGILILFGGGLSLAAAMKKSGLIEYLSDSIQTMDTIPFLFLMFILTALTLFLTELMSNVALTMIFTPMIFGIAQGYGYNPIHLALPATLAASCAFMLPVSTPPNAIVFSSKLLKIKDMVKAGFFLNLLSILILVVISYFFGHLIL